MSEAAMNGQQTEIGCVLVVGAGTMGSGIAQVVAEAHIPTILCDADPAGLERGLAAIATRWDRLAASGRRTAAETGTYATYLSAGYACRCQ